MMIPSLVLHARGTPRRLSIAGCALAAGIAVVGCGATTASKATPPAYPTEPITIVSTTAAGGSTDVVAREFALIANSQHLSPKPIEVIDEPGGSNQVGFQYVESKDSPYYVVSVPGAGILGNIAQNKLSFSTFTNACVDAYDANVVTVAASSPYQTLAQLVSAAKTKALRTAVVAFGGGGQLAAELLAHESGAKFTYISYKSGAQAVDSLVGGFADLDIQSIPETESLLQAGKVRALAIMSSARAPQLPNVPTAAQAGYPITYEIPTGLAMLSSAATHQSLTFMEDLCSRVTKTQAWKTYEAKNGITPTLELGAAANAVYRHQFTLLKPAFQALGYKNLTA